MKRLKGDRDLKARFERKTGVIFGTFRANNPDCRFLVRVGYGGKMPNFEAGILGRSVYAGYAPEIRKW
jgi:hypothetical protein